MESFIRKFVRLGFVGTVVFVLSSPLALAQGREGIWVTGRDGFAGDSPVWGGTDNQQDIFVCRAEHNGELIPGKLHTNYQKCYVAYGHKEHEYSRYSVLQQGGYWWEPLTGAIPSNAVIGGSDKGEPLFICISIVDGEWTTGKYLESHDVCYSPWGGEEHSNRELYILVYQ